MGFKPCYKWITFNTGVRICVITKRDGFKPCYKWITFNTTELTTCEKGFAAKVLNLVINGLPSILKDTKRVEAFGYIYVLNLVINGLPSILQISSFCQYTF